MQGDTITYTIDVANTGANSLTSLEVSDVLPPGVSYVANSAAITGARQMVQYRDQFDTRDYDNTDGLTDWSGTPWVEFGDDGNITTGDVEVESGQNASEDFVLTIQGDDRGVRRPIPLANCASAEISFDWRPREDLEPDNETYLEFSTDGTTWVRQPARFRGQQTTTYSTHTQSIPAVFLVADAEVRFATSTNNNATIYIDNVNIDAVCDIVTPGTAVDAPTNLVTTSDDYAIAPGEIASVTFDVTIDTLGFGVTELDVDNTATAAAAGLATLTSNTVTHTVVTLPSFEGTVYFDRDASNDRSAGDPAIGVAMWAKLVNSGGAVVDVAVVDLDTGAFELAIVPAGNYTVVLDDDSNVADATPAPPSTWSFASAGTGSLIAVSGGNGAADVTDLDFGLTRDADLELTKTIDASTAYVGGAVTYIVSLTNNGPQPSSSVVVTDVLPAGLGFLSATGAGTYASGPGEWSIGAVGVGQTVEIELFAAVDGPYNLNDVVTNVAEVSSALSNDPDATHGNSSTDEDDDDSVDFTIVAPPTADIVVTKNVDVTDAGVGDIIAYTITVTNDGPDDIAGGVLDDVLPGELRYLTYSTTPIGSGAYNPISSEWQFGSLANGQTKSLRINAEVLEPPTITQSVTVTNRASVDVAPVFDGDLGNNSSTVDFDVPFADISLVKTIDGVDTIIADVLTNHTFTISVTNAGPDPVADVVIADVLSSDFVLQNVVPSLGSYDQGLWTIPSLPVGTETLDLVVTLASAGVVSNTAEIISAAGADDDSVPGNGDLTEDDMDRVTLTVLNASGGVASGLPGAVCLAIADQSGTFGVSDLLTRIARDANTEVPISVGTNGTGTSNIESSALDPATGLLYTADAGNFGAIDINTGDFIGIGPAAIGSGFGFATATATSVSQLAFNDIDGMHFDPTTGALFASVRRAGDPADLLIQIDPATGTFVPNAFDTDGDVGTVEDYVLIDPVTSSGSLQADIDALGVDLDGSLYGIANGNGNGDQVLVRINKLTGDILEQVGVVYRPASLGGGKMNDIEGMSFDLQGQLYVTTGSAGNDPTGFYDVDKTPVGGQITALTYQALTLGNDYEALTCSLPATDLGVDKAIDNVSPDSGSDIEYTVTITNNGPTIATGIEIDDVLPAGLAYVSSTPSAGSGLYAPGTGVWQLGGLAVGEMATLTIVATVTAPAGTTIVNTALLPERLPGVLAMDQPDSDLTNNSDSVVLYVELEPADIRGTIFDDVERDESISATDTPIPNVTVELFEDTDDDGVPDGPAIATTTTLPDGTYVFNNVGPGTYLVVETDPSGLGSVTDIDGTNDNTISVTLDGSGADSNGNDFLDTGIDYGDAPASYGSAAAVTNSKIYLGGDVTRDADDRNDDTDADDGVDFANATITTGGYTLPVTVTNTTDSSVWVCGHIDLDKNGTFDAGEESCDEVLVGETEASLNWTGVDGLSGNSFTRFRVASSLAEAQLATGATSFGEVEDYPINLATLPVTVAYFGSKRVPGGIDVTWWSGTETGNAGYILYGDKRGELTALSELIVGAGDSFTPLEYTLSIPRGNSRFWLADVDLQGHETLHGPYRAGKTVGSIPAPVSLDWETSQAEVDRAASADEADRIDDQNQTTVESTVVAAVTSVISSTIGDALALLGASTSAPAVTVAGAGNTAVISVETAGIHRITSNGLLEAGLNWRTVRMDSLAIIDSAGEPVPIRVSGGKKFRNNRFVEFYGEPLDTLYTGTNVYRLVVDPSKQVLMDTDKSRVRLRQDAVDTFVHTEVVEDQHLYSAAAPGDDPWHAADIFSWSTGHDTVVELDHVAPGDGSISVTVWGALDFAPEVDHEVSVVVNGVDVGTVEFGALDEAVVTATLPDGVLVEGANVVSVRAGLAPGMPFDWVNLDRIEISHPRRIVAVDGTVAFTGSGDRFVVSGLTSLAVEMLRIDADGDVARLRRKKLVEEADGTFTISFAGSDAEASYVVTQIDRLISPDIAAARTPAGLLDGTADLLVISHSAFSGHLGDLVAAREAQGLSVKIVEVEDLYAAYTGEVFDPSAISAYISDAAAAFGDPAVLLVGADSRDYRNSGGGDSIAYIPTIYGDVGVGSIAWSPIDPAFVDLDGDLVPDLDLGRFPVRNLAELDNAIAKAVSYTPDNSAVVASEAGFGDIADEIAAALPADTTVTTAHLDELSIADARSVLIGGIDAGAGLTVFFGHSSTDQWTAQGLLTTADADDLTNTEDPTVVIQFGCWNTYFSDPMQQSLGSALLTEEGGAAVVLGATTLTSSVHDAMFGPHLMDAVGTSATVGEAMTTAKQTFAASLSAPDIAMGWTLLGDPTTPLD